jgi:hypothetical protein
MNNIYKKIPYLFFCVMVGCTAPGLPTIMWVLYAGMLDNFCVELKKGSTFAL